jgi:hypothetical protein
MMTSKIPISFIFTVVISLMLPLAGRAIEVSGDQWGTWTKGSTPYNVVGEVHVPQDSTLVIEPGVIVNFQGHYKLIVDSLATLRAIGTVTDSIYFTTQDTATGWHGIRFLYASDNSQISYSHLEYGKAIGTPEENQYGGALYCYNSSPTITHNAIRNNTAYRAEGGIACHNHSGIIEYNDIFDNVTTSTSGSGGGIYSSGDIDAEGPQIKNNTICRNRSRNGAGIYCFRSTLIEGNIINDNSSGFDCTGVGIHIAYKDVVIKNNSICYNEGGYGGYGGGIYVTQYGATITGNIICGNSAGHGYDGSLGGGIYGGSLILTNNTIADNDAWWGRAVRIFGISTISNSIIMGSIYPSTAPEDTLIIQYSIHEGGWPGVGNLDEDPLFVDPRDGNYSLLPRSPCIDAGDPEMEVPENGGDRIDMGALEFRQRFNGLLHFEGYPEFAYAGSAISWEVSLFNPTPYPQMIDGWIDFSGPVSGVSLKYLDRTIQPGEWRETVAVPIPTNAPEGLYTVKGRVGIYGEAIWDSEVFDLEIMERPKHSKIAFY